MALKNFQPRTKVQVVTYRKHFLTHSEGGFLFKCDEQGNIDATKLEAPGQDSLAWCLANTDKLYKPPFVERDVHTYYEHAQGECLCGCTVVLNNTSPSYAYLGNECACGRLYSLTGQELRPRAEWEERVDY